MANNKEQQFTLILNDLANNKLKSLIDGVAAYFEGCTDKAAGVKILVRLFEICLETGKYKALLKLAEYNISLIAMSGGLFNDKSKEVVFSQKLLALLALGKKTDAEKFLENLAIGGNNIKGLKLIEKCLQFSIKNNLSLATQLAKEIQAKTPYSVDEHKEDTTEVAGSSPDIGDIKFDDNLFSTFG